MKLFFLLYEKKIDDKKIQFNEKERHPDKPLTHANLIER